MITLCQTVQMTDILAQQSLMTKRLVDALYVEAMVVADESRAYFDHLADTERDTLGPMARLSFSCEALKATTRLMHVIAWLLAQRAIERGELPPGARSEPRWRLGEAVMADREAVATFPYQARSLILATEDLYERAQHLDRQGQAAARPDDVVAAASPARDLLRRLEGAF